ncbi:MAG: SIMPL domain-containing protein [Halobacteriales archaeon]
MYALSVQAGVDQAGPLIDAAVPAGPDRIHGLQFTLTDEHRQTARQEALTHAMGNAEAIADAAGISIDGVGSVSTAAPTVTPFGGRLETAAAPVVRRGSIPPPSRPLRR